MRKLKNLNVLSSKNALQSLPEEKILINTINAHSYNISFIDKDFDSAISNGHVLIPDGISIVIAIRILQKRRIERITGYDLFEYEMKRINKTGGSCFFLGSTEKNLSKIRERAAVEYPNIRIHTYSPPFKERFTDNENKTICDHINQIKPDVLLIGMTAPKQEKWAKEQFNNIDAKHICSIGAVFDFYSGNIKRAPQWIQKIGLEWGYRLVSEPSRLWRRYLIGNTIFINHLLKEYLSSHA